MYSFENENSCYKVISQNMFTSIYILTSDERNDSFGIFFLSCLKILKLCPAYHHIEVSVLRNNCIYQNKQGRI